VISNNASWFENEYGQGVQVTLLMVQLTEDLADSAYPPAKTAVTLKKLEELHVRLRAFMAPYRRSLPKPGLPPESARSPHQRYRVPWPRDLSNCLPKRRAVFEGCEGLVSATAFTPDGKAVASGSDDPTVRLWDRTTGKGRVLAELSLVRTMDFAPDGKLLAVAGIYGHCVLTVLNLADSEHVWKFALKGHTGLAIPGVAFAPDGQTLASCGMETVRLWDVAAQAEQTYSPLMGHGPGVSSVAFSPDGQALASVDRVPDGGLVPTEYRLIWWDVASRTKRREWTLPKGGLRCVKFAADGRHLAVGGMNGTLYLLRVAPRVSRLVP
jgi:hypothetical protein